ncbi:hypothetical protein PTTG_26634 [Puccinia triticina 1-1 BBBD Race 1]|uniref:Uncharacterized protein n=1 Tax=Puccinia triticina (isolate 1-1 / race 1 (BBBD)) TaxID=630390 RepID=A0A180GSZ8_PUCT1|nr:hypothetical protein PTTG_26634 [Puccinia triticina 1-1 BBBD Race 1]WAR58786.1 hypothetical protein PtB15_10B125 [Puccinia triticina]
MTRSQIAANCFVRTADNMSNHDLGFEGALKLTHVHNGQPHKEYAQKHYVVDIETPSTIRSTYVGARRGRDKVTIKLISPCLEEFGHNLAAGETYIIKGNVDEDHYCGLTWQINPLLACVRFPVICNYPVNRMIVYGRGRVKEVIELCDEAKATIVQHKVVVNISYENSPVGLNVRVVMHYSDAPPDLGGGFMPGVELIFRGYLTRLQTDDEMMRVGILSHDEVRRGSA